MSLTTVYPRADELARDTQIMRIALLVAGIAICLPVSFAAERRLSVPRSALGTSVAVVVLLVLVGLGVGLGRGGDFNAAGWEVRAFIYLAAMFVLASQLLATRRAWAALAWTLVCATGL